MVIMIIIIMMMIMIKIIPMAKIFCSNKIYRVNSSCHSRTGNLHQIYQKSCLQFPR